MEDELHRRVIGQDAAIKSLSQAIRRTRPGTRSGPAGRSSSQTRPASADRLSKTLAEFLSVTRTR
jgi:ATP-dependent Clp protease ATP-binding subunit ClpC